MRIKTGTKVNRIKQTADGKKRETQKHRKKRPRLKKRITTEIISQNILFLYLENNNIKSIIFVM